MQLNYLLCFIVLQCDSNTLAKEFGRFGDVSEVIIPVREDGKKKGFGIVQFKHVSSAAEAIKHINGTALLGMLLD